MRSYRSMRSAVRPLKFTNYMARSRRPNMATPYNLAHAYSHLGKSSEAMELFN